MFGLLRRLRREPPLPAPGLWHAVRARTPWVARLDGQRDARLQSLVARFLADKTLTPVGGLALDEVQRAQLAALCCLPLLEFGAQGLRGWRELIVYPEAFRVNRSHVDAAGVLHEWDDELIGEAWEAGPLILSWADIESDLAEPDAGFCVAGHEMAHKNDVLDGVLDGTPPLPRAWQRQWAEDFQRSDDDVVAQGGRGAYAAIDPYAAEAPEEFGAVCSEYHCSDPATLRRPRPEVAAHLERCYGRSPFAATAPAGG